MAGGQKLLRLSGLALASCGLVLAQLPGGPSKFQFRTDLFPSHPPAAVSASVKPLATVTNTIPLWNYSVVSPVDGLSYSGSIVGRNPAYHGHRSTRIPTILVPVRLTFSDGTIIDPTAPDPCIGNNNVTRLVTNSPIFTNSSYTINGVDVGAAQYGDAFQRANFWSSVAGMPYHTILDLTVAPAVNISVNAPASGFGCGSYGSVDINSLDTLLQQSLIPALSSQGVGPTTLPVFLLPNVAMCDTSICAGGYHNAYNSAAMQTYIVSMVDTTGRFGGGDISILSHEVGEWLNDPTVTNLTPSWGRIGQVTGCQNNLEVADPLTGTFAPAVVTNGFAYHPQELAFFSWFFRQAPSLGAGGAYSSNGTFKTGAGIVCQ